MNFLCSVAHANFLCIYIFCHKGSEKLHLTQEILTWTGTSSESKQAGT